MVSMLNQLELTSETGERAKYCECECECDCERALALMKMTTTMMTTTTTEIFTSNFFKLTLTPLHPISLNLILLGLEVVVCPSQVFIQKVKETLRSDVSVGSQDVYSKGPGAHTGETNAEMLTSLGVEWAIIGHSERRGNGESNEAVAAKAKYALDNGLSVMACCGEPLESREAGTTNDFVFPQIKAYADVFTKEDWKKVS